MTTTTTHAKPVAKKAIRAAPKVESKIYVDATNHIVGRLASKTAKELLRGKTITIVNAEHAVFTGNPRVLAKLWQTRLDLRPRGDPENAPRFSKMPHFILREIIEGMLPSKRARGRDAMRRLKLHIGVPASIGKVSYEKWTESANEKTKGVTSVLALAEALGYNGNKE